VTRGAGEVQRRSSETKSVWPAGGPAADRGVRPTILDMHRLLK